MSHTRFFRLPDHAVTDRQTACVNAPSAPPSLPRERPTLPGAIAVKNGHPRASRCSNLAPSGPWTSSARAAKETWSAQAPLICM